MSRARIVVVDDHELFRESLVSLLALEHDLEVVGQASNGLEALQIVEETRPDLVLMDLQMPVCGGLQATRHIHQRFPATRLLILSISSDEDDLLQALRAGANGYVQKDSGKSVFLRSIRQVLAALRHAMEQLEQAPIQLNDSDLTNREHEVLKLMVDGASNEEISRQLSVSLFTVKSHVRNILHKLGADNRRAAAKVAVQRGIVVGRR